MDNYYHDDQVIEGFRDYRADTSRPPSSSELYYIVFRVKTGNAVWYHHTVQAFDYDLHSHILSLKCVLLAGLNRAKAEISCVFVRSFIPHDSTFLLPADQQLLITKRSAIFEKAAPLSDVPKLFTVVGIAGGNSIILTDVESNDALDANMEAANLIAERFNQNLDPIETMAVSPVIPGIIRMFEAKVPQLRAHLNSSTDDRHIAG